MLAAVVATLVDTLLATNVAAQTAAPADGVAKAAAKAPATKVPPTPEADVRAELDSQVVAWNHGDLKGYMRGYWHSPDLTFFVADKESAGWDAAYQRYRAAYSGKDKDMGKLKFSGLRVELLSPQAAFVRGAWQLTMKDGSKRNGLFTLILKKFGDSWRIIHDHSS
jgi:ketosteroid isomerase-like protein